MLFEKLYGFLDNHANTSLCRFAGICIVPLYVHETMKGVGVAEGIKTGTEGFYWIFTPIKFIRQLL